MRCFNLSYFFHFNLGNSFIGVGIYSIEKKFYASCVTDISRLIFIDNKSSIFFKGFILMLSKFKISFELKPFLKKFNKSCIFLGFRAGSYFYFPGSYNSLNFLFKDTDSLFWFTKIEQMCFCGVNFFSFYE